MNPIKDQPESRFWQYLRQHNKWDLNEVLAALVAGLVPEDIIAEILTSEVDLGTIYYFAIYAGYKKRLSGEAAKKMKRRFKWAQSVEKKLASAAASRKIKGNIKKEGKIGYVIMVSRV